MTFGRKCAAESQNHYKHCGFVMPLGSFFPKKRQKTQKSIRFSTVPYMQFAMLQNLSFAEENQQFEVTEKAVANTL